MPDIECSLQDLLRPHLRKSGFQWNATFIGTGCRELELLQLPSSGYTFVLVVHNPGGGSVTNLSSKTVLRCRGEGMMVNLCDVHVGGGQGMCLMVVYHSFVTMNVEPSAPGPKPSKKVESTSVDVSKELAVAVGVARDSGANASDLAIAPTFVNMFNLVQACCEPKNLLKRPSSYNEDLKLHIINL